MRALALGLLVTGTAPAAELRVLPERGRGPADAYRGAVGIVVQWHGAPADLQVSTDTGWRTVATGHTGRIVLRTAPGGRVRAVRDGAVLAETPAVPLWGPEVFAAWSGPGLRGAEVVDLVASPGGLWAATAHAGAAVWDGLTWRTLDARAALADDDLTALDLDGGTRWIASRTALTRLTAEGVLTSWTEAVLPGPITDLLADPEGVWVATPSGVFRVEDTPRLALARSDCERLVRGPTGAPAAACDVLRPLTETDHGLPTTPASHAFVPRMGGAWLADHDTLWSWVDGQTAAWWTAPSGALHDLSVLGGGLALAAGTDGLRLLTEQGLRSVTRADGLPGEAAWSLGPATRPDKVWVGTDRGVALVTASGGATALPLAPLPAGVAAYDATSTRRAAVVAGEAGCTWLGTAPPKGWDALRAAVGPRCMSVLQDGPDWWAANRDAAFRLTRGRVERWAPGAEVRALLPGTPGVVLATRSGVRRWLPGATQLAPLEPIDGLLAADAGADDALWAVTGEAVVRIDANGARTWPARGARDVAATGSQALVATEAGLLLIDLARDEPTPVATPDGTSPRRWSAVTVGGGGIWAATDTGLYRVTREGPRLSVTLPDGHGPTTGLTADPRGVWWATASGMHLLVPSL